MERIIIFNSSETVPGTQNLCDFVREQIKGQQVVPHNFRPWKGDVSEKVAFILLSSGTTGLAKGVMLTHKNMNVRMVQIL